MSTKQLEEIVDDAEGLLHDREDREMTTRELGELVMERLREIDPVAYVRFASVYRQFEDVGEFMQEVQALERARREG